jgi:hypothetical protein
VSMVVGIFSDHQGLRVVVDGLTKNGVDLDRLRVVTCDEVPTELATSGVQYVWIGDVQRSAPSDIMTSGGGTSMPSGNGGNGFFENELDEALSELAIPDGKTDDYARAVEAGQLVVGYPSLGIDAATLRQLYDAAGASSIDEF